MCLQIPLKVLSVVKGSVIAEGDRKLVNKGNVSIKPGDYVLPYGNVVVTRVDKKSARKMLSALAAAYSV